MQCAKCGSDNTQRLEVAYQSGTQNISTRSHSAAVGSVGTLGVGGVVTNTRGTSQSMLAQKVAPPEKKSIGVAVFIIVIGVLMGFGSVSRGSTVTGFLLLAGGGYLCYTTLLFNSQKWPEMYRNWLNSWHCLKCGNVYYQA